MRHALAGFCLVVIVVAAGCSGGEMSLTEYVERVDAIMTRGLQRYGALIASPEGEVLTVNGAQLADFTPQDLQVALERLGEIQAEAMEEAATIEPPVEIADLHTLFFRRLPIEELAARAGTAADWEEASNSPEMAAYRAALVRDEQVCVDFQAKLDATAERGVFAEASWIPGDLKEIVDYALGCGSILERPEDVYSPTPSASS